MTFRTGSQVSGVLAALSLALFPLPVRARDQIEELQTTSKWNVDWATAHCTLQRTLGSKTEPFLFRMNSYGPDYDFEFYLAGKALDHFKNRDHFEIAFGSRDPMPVQRIQRLQNNKIFGPGVIFSQNIRSEGYEGEEKSSEPAPFPDEAFERQLDKVVLSTGSRRLVLATGPMEAALNALRQCTDAS